MNAASARILTYEEAEDLRENGWCAADLHVHTSYSADVLATKALHPETLYLKGRKLGMDFITFTDHDTMAAFDILGRKRDGLVSGVELKIKDLKVVGHTIHINIFDLDKEQFLELKEIADRGDLYSLLDCINEYKLPFVYNHPLWFEKRESPNLTVIPNLIKLFPAIEYNMNLIARKNELTMELASKHNKGLISATDTHSGRIGNVFTLAKGYTFAEFFRNIRKGNSYIVVEDLTREDIIEEINSWIDLIFSSTSYEKSSCITGVSYLDKIIKILSSETLRDYPKIGRIVMSLSYRISKSGLPAAIYFRSEKALLPKIEKWLEQVLNS